MGNEALKKMLIEKTSVKENSEAVVKPKPVVNKAVDVKPPKKNVAVLKDKLKPTMIQVSKKNADILQFIKKDMNMKNFDEVLYFMITNCNYGQNEGLKNYLSYKYNLKLK